MIFLFYILAALLIYQSYKSFRGGVDYLNYFKHELAKPLTDHTPFVTVFAPCRGVDQGMLENIDALLAQNYPEYEVVFIVDEQNDEATGVIEVAWREARRPVKLVVAPKATDSGQKVTNLREGITYADKRSEVFVFVDSDVRPSKDWLRHLVAPLTDERVGAATGYRWFISDPVSFAAEMRSMWNASIASALGANRKTNYFCWGGATAVRREIFETLKIQEHWLGTLSDDFVLARVIREAGLEIHFVPGALTASIEDCSMRELFEFTTRQMKITRVYAPNLWKLSFIGSGLFNLVMISALLIMIFSTTNGVAVVVAMFTLLMVTVFSVGKSFYRMKAVELALPQYQAKLRRQMLPQMVLWSVTPTLFFCNCFAAWMSRRVIWRNTKYEMISATETRILEPKGG